MGIQSQSLSAQESAREELRLLLKELAILYSDKEQPIKMRDQKPAPWMFYSWTVTMNHHGILLAASCLLERLKDYKGTQLATFGYTGMPLLMACLILGEGKYSGISIRDERKEYGSSRRIEGAVNKEIPVVVLDDSLSSGTSMLKAIQALEEEGFNVEGGLCLVNFPWRGGMERVQGLGYRVEALYDIWKDLEMPLPAFSPIYKRVLPEKWGEIRIESGLHPAHAARRAAEIYLSKGIVAEPPASLDKPYDASGGTFVSFRYRETDHRLVRDGFWHYDPADADPCRDVVLAAVKTIKASQGKLTLDELKRLKIAVTFFGPLEKIPPAKLDFLKYGIVARSRAYDTKMGGALPNTEVFINEVDQYHHARVRNAKIGNYEPHDLYRHTLTKCVEPGEYWLPYGFPVDPATDFYRNDAIGTSLTRRAQAYLEAAATGKASQGEPLPNDLIPAPVFAVSVTLYHKGIAGCGVAWGDSLDSCVEKGVSAAFGDQRFKDKKKNVSHNEMGISVSILHDREWLGEVPLKNAEKKMRRGLDSLSAQKDGRGAIFLPVVATYYNWTKEQITRQLLKKAKITRLPAIWSTYKTATWLRRGNNQWKLTFGFPDRSEEKVDPPRWKSFIGWMGDYILNQVQPDGLPAYLYFPVIGKGRAKGTSARIVHALGALSKAGRLAGRSDWQEAAAKGLRVCVEHLRSLDARASSLALPGQQEGALSDCILLTALAESGNQNLTGEPFHRLASRVRDFFVEDGRITPAPNARGLELDYDFFPGSALLALASYARAAGDLSVLEKLGAQLEWHSRRFRALHPWGNVGWQTQGWGAVYEQTREKRHADFVFEIADWALDWQHEKTGAFLTELHAYGLSFHTLFLAEGMAAAWKTARLAGDRGRAERYRHSCSEAIRFLNQILIHPEDTFCMADPNKAVGGVRGSLSTSDVRIDYVSHSLLAVVNSAENL